MQHFYETCNANVHRSVYQLAAEATEAYEAARPRCAASSTPAPSTRSSSPRTPPRASTSSPTRGAGPTSARATSWCSPRWSTTPTSCPGTSSPPSAASSSAGCRSPPTASSTSPTSTGCSTAPRCSASRPCRTCSARSPRSAWLSDAAHAAGALAIVDACQYVPHIPTDVQAMGADFLAFSAHKMCGPTGIGVLWGREELLDAMPPFLGGGDMIGDVRLDGFTPDELPAKFEAGTPPIAEAIGLGAAVDYLDGPRHGHRAGPRDGRHRLRHRPLDGRVRRRHHDPRPDQRRDPGRRAVSFAFRDLHPHDISQVLDQSNVCVRAGHHCAKPLMRVLGVGRHGAGHLLRVQRRGRRRRPGRRARRRRQLLRPLTRIAPMPGLEDLYREIILDHYRHPRNRVATTTRSRGAARPPCRGFNPLCGDEIVVYLDADDGVVDRRQHRRPGLLDQPELGVDDVGGGEGQDDRTRPGRSSRLQGR